MSTIKISELTPLGNFNSNTSNTLFVVVDLGNNITQQISFQTLLNQVFGNVSVINFSDGSQQGTAGATFAYSSAGFNQANQAYTIATTANNTGNYANTLARTANTTATNAYNNSETNLTQIIYLGGALNSANVYANASFAKANSALANTTSIITAKDLTVLGNNVVNGTSTFTNGVLYVPKIVGPSTTLTINFNTDSMIKTNGASGLVVTLSNFVAGKEVSLWFTSTAGSTQSITHGCLANNSTLNNTSFTIPGNSSAYLKYFSFDGTLSNTFVSIIHA